MALCRVWRLGCACCSSLKPSVLILLPKLSWNNRSGLDIEYRFGWFLPVG